MFRKGQRVKLIAWGEPKKATVTRDESDNRIVWIRVDDTDHDRWAFALNLLPDTEDATNQGRKVRVIISFVQIAPEGCDPDALADASVRSLRAETGLDFVLEDTEDV